MAWTVPSVAALLLALTFTAACSSSMADLPSDPNAGGYTIAAGDKIKITVEGEKDFSGAFTVDAAGEIQVPMAGTLKVATLSMSDAAVAFAAKLRDAQILRNAKVSVEVVSVHPILVLGEVKRPGQYAYVSGMTLKAAVSLAEGYTYYAKESSAEVTRAGRTVDVDVDTDIKILPGDTIRVPRRLF
jgi:polysaccharide biosynthesis/export protein